MICSIDEFLLVVQKWITESTAVSFVLMVFDDPKEAAVALRLQGRVVSIDTALPGFTFLSGEDGFINGFIVVDLKAWQQIGYADKGFGLSRPGASIALSISLP